MKWRVQRTQWNKRLLTSTRGKILALLRTDDRTVSELASQLKVTDNAVRAQLLTLERDGLVRQRGVRRGTRKPHFSYALSSDAEHIFPKAYGMLCNHFVAAISKRLPPRGLRSAMREVGSAVASTHLKQVQGRNFRERVNAAVQFFNDDLGGAAKYEEANAKRMIHSRNGCPLAAVTANHPEACLILESMLGRLIGVPVRKCCEYAGTPRCCFELTDKSRV
jgi:predicted ArsR family transcriptional regulator